MLWLKLMGKLMNLGDLNIIETGKLEGSPAVVFTNNYVSYSVTFASDEARDEYYGRLLERMSQYANVLDVPKESPVTPAFDPALDSEKGVIPLGAENAAPANMSAPAPETTNAPPTAQAPANDKKKASKKKGAKRGANKRKGA